MRIRLLVGVLVWGGCATAFAQGASPAAPAAAAITIAPTAPGSGKDASTDASVPDQMSGKRGRSGRFDHKAPTNVRIQESGIKLPKCTQESREGEACK